MAFGSQSAVAQQSTGDILGIVTDPAGAVIPKATVTYTNAGTHDTRTVQTDQSGAFTFPNLNPGNYTVSVSASGFGTANTTAFGLLAGDRHRVDTQLKVGSATETVEVATTAASLQTDSSALSNSITSEAVANLPLNGRNYVQLVQITPGATEGNPTGLATGNAPDDRRQGSSVSINSQSPALNNNMIDGLDNNERIIGTVGVRPSIDSIQEVKVLTNSYTADSGRAAGAVVNIISKSGTNNFHGSLYEFFRNDKLNTYAYQFGAKSPKPELRQNQFGGSLGGPIIKDRTFFFGDVEFFRLVQQKNPTQAGVPTLFELNNPGNFSDLTNHGNCNPGGAPITTPASYVVGCAYNPVTGLQYAGNIIPTSALDPVGLAYLQLYPKLNNSIAGHEAFHYQTADQTSPTGNGVVQYTNSFNKLQYSTTYDIRVDHKLTSADSIYARYSLNSVFTHTPAPALPNEVVTAALTGKTLTVDGQNDVDGDSPQTARNAQLNYTHTFTPNLLLLLGAGYTYVNNFSTPPNYGLSPNAAFGEPGVNFSQLTSALGGVGPGGGLAGFGAGRPGFVPLQDKDNTYQISGSVFYTRGKNAYKFGAALIRRQAYNYQESNGMGNMTFSNGAAGLLTGFYSGVTRGNSFFNGQQIGEYYRTWEPSVFAADDWRVTQKLTLNLGVRWDMFTPYNEKYDHIANFTPDNGGTLLVPGVNGVSRAANVNYTYKNFQPRLGFAYNPTSGTVIRGGFGLSFFPTNYTSVGRLVNQPFVFSFSCNNGSTCPSQFQFLRQGLPQPGDPLIDPARLAFNCGNTALGSPIPAAQCLSQAISSSEPNYRDAYLEQFNLTVQQQFMKMTMTVAYVGALGRHIGDAIGDTNLVPLAAAAAQQSGRRYFAKNPNLGNVPALLSDGASNYHGLQAIIERRFANGLGFQASTTWSHMMDNGVQSGGGGTFTAISLDPASPYYHNRYDYGNGDLDQRNRFVFSGNYAPSFLANRHGVLGAVIGGWRGNVLSVWTTGLPFTITNGTNQAHQAPAARGGDRPDQIGDPFAGPIPAVFGQVPYFNANISTTSGPTPAYKLQTAGTGGNSKRNLYHAPPGSHVDASLAKTFPVHEQLKLEFRAEAFNVLNSVQFNGPNAGLPAVGSAVGTSGYITSTRGDYNPRLMQFALRLDF